MRLLLVYGTLDVAQRYAAYWLRRLAQYARSRGHLVEELRDPKLYELREALASFKPDLVVISGHGGPKAARPGSYVVVGVPSYDPELGVKVRWGNPHWFKGMVVYLFTCSSGEELGPAIKAAGARAVLAYKDPFLFLTEDHLDPSRDRLAAPFFQAALAPVLALLRGASPQRAYLEALRAFRSKAAQAPGEAARRLLLYDASVLVLY